MSSFASAASYIPLIQEGLGLVTQISSGELSHRDSRQAQANALKDLQARQSIELRAAQENATLDRSRIAAQAKDAEDKRLKALKRAVARQRAQFGSSGISPGSSGSAQAVLLGLFDESEEDQAQREKMDRLRLGAIDQNIGQRRRINVLQQTQLREKQNIGRLSSSVDRFGNLASSGLDVFRFGKKVNDLF